MRRVIGALLVLLGIAGVALAILLPTVVVPHAKKIPLDLNTTLRSTGGAKLLDPATGQTRDVQLRSTQIVRTDSHASDGTNTTLDESLCTVIVLGNTPDCPKAPDPRLLGLTTDRMTVDRKSAEGVHVAKYGESVNGDTSARHVGVGYTFAIDAKKQTYQFYLPDLGKAFPAVFNGTSKINGLTVFKYVSATGSQPYQIQGKIPGTYTDTRTVFVEPRTGVIVNGIEHQVQTLANGAVALDTTLAFDRQAIDFQADYAKDKIRLMRLGEIWGPIGGGVIGIAALVGGLLLLRASRGTGGEDDGRVGRHSAPPPDSQSDYVDPPTELSESSQT